MAEAAVQLKLAGQTYRVVTSADETDLTRLARVVEEAIFSVTTPGRQPSPQAVVLAAITLAHELEQERSRREQLETRHREMLTQLLTRIDRVLDETKDAERDGAERSTPEQTAEVPRVAPLRMGTAPLENGAPRELGSRELAPRESSPDATESAAPALSLARSSRGQHGAGQHGGGRLASDAWKLDGPNDR